MTFNFVGYPIASLTPNGAVELLVENAIAGPSTTYRLVNAGTLDAAATRPDYQELLKGEGVNLPDGRPLATLLRITGSEGEQVHQVRGPQFFEDCLDTGRAHGLRHFFFGASEETLNQLVSAVERKFPGVNVAGAISPPFGPRTQWQLANDDKQIIESGANIVWVALGTPKQDAEALRILKATGVTTAAVGAAFDFTAGTKRQAPVLFRRLHSEWLFRLATEPRRLWKRYLVGNARFVWMAFRHLASTR